MAVNTTASKCKVKMQLLGDYFIDDDPTDLTVTGFVKLDYVGRRLYDDSIVSDTNKKRSLSDKSEGSKFTLDVSLSDHEVVVDDTTDYSTPDDEEVASNVGSNAYGQIVHGSLISVLMIVVTGYMMKIGAVSD